jgi:drug/metabolite transporter (DMT)-like permease
MIQLAQTKSPARKLHIAFALVAVYLIWGSTYLAIRYAIGTMPPFLMASFRFLIAGAILYAFARLRGAARPHPRTWLPAAVLGATLLLCGNGGVVWAEQRLDSSFAALIISIEPLWIVLLGWMYSPKDRPSARIWTGVGLGLGGLLLLLRPSAAGHIDIFAAVVVVLASVAWAWGSLYGQRAKLPQAPLLTIGMQMLCGGLFLGLAGLATGEAARFDVASFSAASLAAFAYLIVFGAIVAYSAYFFLLRNASPSLVSTYAYINPLVAVLLGWAIAGEKITSSTLGAAAIILAGVAIIATAPSGPSRAAVQEEGSEQPAAMPRRRLDVVPPAASAARCGTQ